MDEKSNRACMMSLDECMQARIMHAHLFYIGKMTLQKSFSYVKTSFSSKGP